MHKVSCFAKKVHNIYDGLPVQEETVTDCYLEQSSVGA